MASGRSRMTILPLSSWLVAATSATVSLISQASNPRLRYQKLCIKIFTSRTLISILQKLQKGICSRVKKRVKSTLESPVSGSSPHHLTSSSQCRVWPCVISAKGYASIQSLDPNAWRGHNHPKISSTSPESKNKHPIYKIRSSTSVPPKSTTALTELTIDQQHIFRAICAAAVTRIIFIIILSTPPPLISNHEVRSCLCSCRLCRCLCPPGQCKCYRCSFSDWSWCVFAIPEHVYLFLQSKNTTN